MRLLIGFFFIVLASAHCPCCEDGKLIYVNGRCNMRLNQVQAKHNQCAKVTSQAAALEAQLATIQDTIAALEIEIIDLENAGNTLAALALGAELTGLFGQEASIDQLLVSSGILLPTCIVIFSYSKTLTSQQPCVSRDCPPISLLQVPPINEECEGFLFSNGTEVPKAISYVNSVIDTTDISVKITIYVANYNTQPIRVILLQDGFNVDGLFVPSKPYDIGIIQPDGSIFNENVYPSIGTTNRYQILIVSAEGVNTLTSAAVPVGIIFERP